MSCCIGSAACCAGEACCSAACCACKSCGVTPKNFPRITYVLFNLLWFAISILLMFTLQPLFQKYDFLECNKESGGGDACLGTAAVLRMSFVLFVFHFLLIIMISPRRVCSSNIHDGWWLAKLIFVIAVYIAVFWIPNRFYFGWAHFARVVSGIYLIVQELLLIILAFTINDKLVRGYENGSTASMVLLIALTTIFSLGTLAFLIL